MLQTIQALYDCDTYSLVDGIIKTEAIKPTKGVKQKLKPALSAPAFSSKEKVFINDFECLGGITLTGQDGKTVNVNMLIPRTFSMLMISFLLFPAQTPCRL